MSERAVEKGHTEDTEAFTTRRVVEDDGIQVEEILSADGEVLERRYVSAPAAVRDTAPEDDEVEDELRSIIQQRLYEQHRAEAEQVVAERRATAAKADATVHKQLSTNLEVCASAYRTERDAQFEAAVRFAEHGTRTRQAHRAYRVARNAAVAAGLDIAPEHSLNELIIEVQSSDYDTRAHVLATVDELRKGLS